MKLKNKLYIILFLAIFGICLSIVAGIMAGNQSLEQIPTSISIFVIIGLISFVSSMVILIELFVFGD